MSATAEESVSSNVSQLAIGQVFGKLSPQEKLYAHHLSRASWHGTRIVLQQVSPEAEAIFDLIIGAYRAVGGVWSTLAEKYGLSEIEIDAFKDYAAQFLCVLGNYYGENGQKFVPAIDRQRLVNLAEGVPYTQRTAASLVSAMQARPPLNLGYPSDKALSAYYLAATSPMSRDEISLVDDALAKHGIEPENTRIQKEAERLVVMQASAETANEGAAPDTTLHEDPMVVLVRGDHAKALQKVCAELETARKYASGELQERTLAEYIRSFRTGDMNAYRESQKLWVTDASPAVENTIGFVEQYRDPAGLRAEWQGIVCLADKDETLRLKEFVDNSAQFIRLLPWAVPDVNNGQGPFEKDRFEKPDFSIVHGLTFCTSNMWHATNIPNYNDIRETCGFKNIVISNRLSVLDNPANPCHFIQPDEKDFFRSTIFVVEFITTSVHELLGHGSGKLLSETSPGVFNFNKDELPINSLTGKPVTSWYLPGQTWTSVFGDIGTAVEEARATLISYYLIDDPELLRVFGYSGSSKPASEDLIYSTYLQAAVEGLKALEAFNEEDASWGEPHARGNFAILAWLLQDADDFVRVEQDFAGPDTGLTIHMDRSKVLSHGKPALGRLLHKLHVWRCSPDPVACREFFEPLTAVRGQSEIWRQVVCAQQEPKWRFVQANTFITHGEVTLKEYDATNEGIIQSWAERDV